MGSIKVALLGLGTVGKGVYETIGTHQQQLQALLGKPVEVVAILVRDLEKERGIQLNSSIILTGDYQEIIKLPKIDFVLEMIGGIEPAKGYIEQAIKKGAHVITANKELMAFHGKELKKMAELAGVRLVYEASVAGAIPVIRTIQELLQVNRVSRIHAIMNGTTNYILTQMRERKLAFEQALIEAQEMGYAEADPSNDIEGWDSFFKLMILSDLVFDEQPNWNQVEREGIEQVTPEQLAIAEQFGLRLKLLASLYRTETGWVVKVKPTFLSSAHPLYSVEGVDNGIVLETDLAGRLFLQGAGAGALTTASAIIEDLINVWQKRENRTQNKGIKWRPVVLNQKIQNNWIMIQSNRRKGKNEEIQLKNRLQQYGLKMHSIEKNRGILDSAIGVVISGKIESFNQFYYQINEEQVQIYPILGWTVKSDVESITSNFA